MLKIIFKNIKNKAGDGFTLIEALVSIALILIAVIGPLTLAMNAINTIIQNKNRVIASYLAEEVVENFKNYRDDFALACSNIYLDTSTDDTTNITTINNAYCGEEGDIGMQVPTNFIGSNDISSTPNTNPRNISWKMFVASTFSSGNNFPDNTIPPKEYFIDDDSFVSNPKNLNIIDYGSSCVNLSFDQIYGYSCSKGSSTVFKRKTKITKISDNTLMIQVDVVYTNYGLFAAGQKSVSVVDYIYER
ncbi:MAG: prepilin-type N-terminal cleavage/methylation domain-containing protein [Candidatus Paceibacterota bacterium]|jgi:type II secretory pathway pseudopilin PulG